MKNKRLLEFAGITNIQENSSDYEGDAGDIVDSSLVSSREETYGWVSTTSLEHYGIDAEEGDDLLYIMFGVDENDNISKLSTENLKQVLQKNPQYSKNAMKEVAKIEEHIAERMAEEFGKMSRDESWDVDDVYIRYVFRNPEEAVLLSGVKPNNLKPIGTSGFVYSESKVDASEVKDAVADAEAERRDPYGYRGLSPRDFLQEEKTMKQKNKQLLNERMLALAGIKHPQIMAFASNEPTTTLNENEVPEHQGVDAYEQEIWNHIDMMEDNPSPGNQDQLEDMIGKFEDMGGDVSVFDGSIKLGQMNEGRDDFYIYTDSTGNMPQLSREPWDSKSHKYYVKYRGNRPVEVKPYPGQDKIWDYSKNAYVPIESIKVVGDMNKDESVSVSNNNREPQYALNEETIRETIGVRNPVTKFKSHGKNLINERFLGIVGLKPLGGVIGMTNNTVSKPKIQEVQSDLSRAELYRYLPMLHSSMLMEIAEEFLPSPSGKSWGMIVEDLTEEYAANASAKSKINKTLKSTGLI